MYLARFLTFLLQVTSSINLLLLKMAGKPQLMLLSCPNVQSVSLYIELTSSFLIGQKRTVIMSRKLEITGNHVMYERCAWFWLCMTLCCLPSVKKQNHDIFSVVHCIIKLLLDSDQKNQGLHKVISLSLIIPTSILIFWLWQKPHALIVFSIYMYHTSE